MLQIYTKLIEYSTRILAQSIAHNNYKYVLCILRYIMLPFSCSQYAEECRASEKLWARCGLS